MINLNIKSDIKEVERMLKSLSSVIVPKAASSAINKTIKTVRAKATKELSIETGIKPQKKIRQSLILRKARPNNLEASITAIPVNEGRGINLIEFVTPAKRKTGAFKKKPGVTAKAWGKSKLFKGSFIGAGRNSGKALVYARTSKASKPIKALHGPSIPRTFLDRRVQALMDRVGRTTFEKNFQREIKFRLSRL